MVDLVALFRSELSEHADVVAATTRKLESAFIELVELCADCIGRGNKILFVGNGGSAADAQHLATELTVRFSANRSAIAAIALTTDTSVITAIGNDLGFDQIFSRQVEALGHPGDVLIAISTSGSSPNVVLAAEQALSQGLKVAALTGGDGGNLLLLANPVLCIPANTTARIQEMHITLGQMFCSALEQHLSLV